MPELTMTRTIVPISRETIYERYADCPTIGKAWIAIDAQNGTDCPPNRWGVTMRDMHYQYRLSIEGCTDFLQEYKQARLASADVDFGLFQAIKMAFEEFRERVAEYEIERLKCWKLTIISKEEDFAETLHGEIPYMDLRGIRRMKGLHAALVSADDLEHLKTQDNPIIR